MNVLLPVGETTRPTRSLTLRELARPEQDPPSKTPVCGHTDLWTARDGNTRCQTCDPPRYQGEIVNTTRSPISTEPTEGTTNRTGTEPHPVTHEHTTPAP